MIEKTHDGYQCVMPDGIILHAKTREELSELRKEYFEDNCPD